MSAHRRAEPGSPHRGGIVGLADFTGGAHRAEPRPASADFRAVMGNFATGVTIITTLDSAVPGSAME